MLTYRPDWVAARQRMEAFWRGEQLDRPTVWATAPIRQSGGAGLPDGPADVEGKWLDSDYLFRAAYHRFRTTYYAGEAVPHFMPYLGPGELALYLGSEPVFAPDTVWYGALFADLVNGPDLRVDEGNRWWTWVKMMTARAVSEGGGQFLVSFPDIIENLDILASLRGTQGLLTDLLDHPAAVHRYQEQILELYFHYYDALATMIGVEEQGTIFSGYGLWMPGRGAKLQCDFSAMISPRMFEEFVLPYLRRQCQRLDSTLYHLDGPSALQHLDLLLSIPELKCIQWVPGDGHDPCASPTWLPLFRRIQAAGKAVYVFGTSHELRMIAPQLDRNLTHFHAHCENREDADGLLRYLESLNKRERAVVRPSC